MSKIVALRAFEILDSRGNPTIGAEVTCEGGISAKASVPSGASRGDYEAWELRDDDAERYRGKGVLKALASVNGALQDLLIGESVLQQARLDGLMVGGDGTENKSRFGANAILAVSLACARAASRVVGLPLYAYLGGSYTRYLPCPMMNIINGGVHADSGLDFQEFMIRPHAAPTFSEALRWGVEVYHKLKEILGQRGFSTSIGDEGGFAPNLSTDEEALGLICEAIVEAGYEPGRQISCALDCAASEFFDPKSATYFEKKKKAQGLPFETRTAEEQVAYLEKLIGLFPIDSIEDGLAQSDWEGWSHMTRKLENLVQIVGDDIFVTNARFLGKGLSLRAANAILIKPNQIGTLTETFQTVQIATSHGWSAIISHRSGETDDSFIADLAVATMAGQIKTGAPCRGERVAKYNRLLEIEHQLSPFALYIDSNKQEKWSS